ncbi:CAP domain-containing protein [Consotaella aegiceratis]|uniref:CAP domain-containing protein n=1 Tax=Consotaella aegiceratis TaxID=3097961 RepID=UPI002F3F302F
MLHRPHALLTSALACLACIALLAGCASFRDRGPTSPVAFDRTQALAEINAFRSQNGLGPLTFEPHLQDAAEAQAETMAAVDHMDHDIDGKLPSRIESHGYQWQATSENLGRGYLTFHDALIGWENSPHHRENLLNKRAIHVGLAAARPAAGGTHYWAMIVAAPLPERRAVGGPTASPGGISGQWWGAAMGGSIRVP